MIHFSFGGLTLICYIFARSSASIWSRVVLFFFFFLICNFQGFRCEIGYCRKFEQMSEIKWFNKCIRSWVGEGRGQSAARRSSTTSKRMPQFNIQEKMCFVLRMCFGGRLTLRCWHNIAVDTTWSSLEKCAASEFCCARTNNNAT